MQKLIPLIFVLILLTGCSPTPGQIRTAIVLTQAALPTSTLAFTVLPPETATITSTPEPTSTSEPTSTPKPTNTPIPTNTPKPSATPTAAQDPIVLNGDTDSVVDLDKWQGPALARIKCSGTGHFAIWNYGANNEKYDLLVNTVGQYVGTVPLDFLDDAQTRRFEVTASGSWEIIVLPLADIRREVIPGKISGSGDDVIFLDGENPDLLIVDGTNAKGNLAIWAYGQRKDLVVNDIAPYSGTVLLDADTLILEITEDGGGWSLEITTN